MPAQRVVVTDAGVLINLIHVDAIAAVAAVPDYEFVVVDAVVEEITDEQQAVAVRTALEQNLLRKESLTEPRALMLFS